MKPFRAQIRPLIVALAVCSYTQISAAETPTRTNFNECIIGTHESIGDTPRTRTRDDHIYSNTLCLFIAAMINRGYSRTEVLALVGEFRGVRGQLFPE